MHLGLKAAVAWVDSVSLMLLCVEGSRSLAALFSGGLSGKRLGNEDTDFINALI